MTRELRLATLGVAAAVLLAGVAFAAAANAVRSHGTLNRPGSTLSDLPAPPASFECPAGPLPDGPDLLHVSQDFNGYLSGCFRVSSLQPGHYTVALQSLATKRGDMTPGPGRIPISLSPTSGRPGTQLTITGYVPGGPSAATADKDESLKHTTVCIGCPGLQESADVSWGAPGHFTIRALVPAVPWLGPAGPLALKPGPVTVGIECLGPVSKGSLGCAGQPQGRAVFTITGPTPSACLSQRPCAWLRLTADAATPGSEVRLQGWAPLSDIGGTPFGYFLAVTARPGATEPSLPLKVPGVSATILTPTRFTVVAGRDWASIGTITPVNVQPSGDAPLATDPSNPQHLAFCGTHGLRVTGDRGRTWSSIPTQRAAPVAYGMGFTLLPLDGSPPSCTSITLDPRHPASLFVRFGAEKTNESIPPVYYIGLVSTDNGGSWRPVPVPSGQRPESFGGFRYDNGVKAYFATTPGLAVEQTTDGGRSWAPSAPGCPPAGPCVTLAGVWDNNCAKFPAPELIQYSNDNGKSWAVPQWPQSLDACNSDELVAASGGTVIAASGRNEFHVMVSGDGGRTWSGIVLPLAANDRGWQIYGDLQLLPNGSLLALSGNGWSLLPPAATSWCNVSGSLASANVYGRTQVIGDHLWWVSVDGLSGRNVALASIHC